MMNANALPANSAQPLDDYDICQAVDRLLLIKQDVAAHLIDVRAEHGAVTLSGYTDNLLARARAGALARTVRGVRQVTNLVLVRTPDVPDHDLQRDVEAALQDDPLTAGLDLQCVASSGVVEVSGEVPWRGSRRLVQRVVQGVRGVRRLHDHLLYDGQGLPLSGTALADDIRGLLRWDVRVNDALIQVQALDGAVVMLGQVASAAERQRAVATAWDAGAHQVAAEQLQVAHWALSEDFRQDKYAAITDSAVAQAIQAVFQQHPRVQAFAPLVRVRQGMAELSGTVTNLRAKRKAEQLARRVVGVLGVSNGLKVRPHPMLADQDVQAHVEAALARDPYVRHFRLQVRVFNGKVYLYGTVDNAFEKLQLEEVAAGPNGVVDVENRVLVADWRGTVPASCFERLLGPAADPGPTAQDLVTVYHIERQLFWSTSVPERAVHVTVSQGRATLTGTLDTRLDCQLALQCAYEGGATSVSNLLTTRSATPPSGL